MRKHEEYMYEVSGIHKNTNAEPILNPKRQSTHQTNMFETMSTAFQTTANSNCQGYRTYPNESVKSTWRNLRMKKLIWNKITKLIWGSHGAPSLL